MKKIVLLFIMICVTLCINAQIIVTSDSINYREYEDRYLFNHCNREGVMNLDVVRWLVNEDNGYCSFINQTFAIPIVQVSSTDSSNIIADFAQLYEVYDTITIAGVSGFVWHGVIPNEFHDRCRWYFEIRDSTLTTVLRSVDISDTAIPHTYYGYYVNNNAHTVSPTSLSYYKYTENFFDEPLTITGKFYVVYHTPDSIDYPTGMKIWSGIFGSNVCTPGIEFYPLKKGGQYDIEYDWNYFGGLGYRLPYPPYDILDDTITALYLFPILADTTGGGDTIVSNLEEIKGLEAVRVFPNPAGNEVNINSGYKIERIFLYDESGKLLQENEVKAYNYKIDLQHYPQGSYLLKVQTTKNQSTHKIIKQ